MSKLRLDLDSIQVETFTASPGGAPGDGTVLARETHFINSRCGYTCYQTRCEQTCNLEDTCYGTTDIDMGCTAYCTGVGVECFTADPNYYACTGGNPCTADPNCTYNTCTAGG